MVQNHLFPAETLRRKLRVVISGQEDVLVERHHGLVGYSEDCVTIRLENGFMRVRGQQLRISEYGPLDLSVSGAICGVEFSKA